jgi:FkbM family methyltransferase
MARVGLLPQAAKLIEDGGASLEPAALRPLELESRIDTLKTEVELLQAELTLALTRGQLASPGQTTAPGDAHDDFATRLKHRSSSQLGQDLWALARSDYKRNGFFVEFGATDGVLLSNSYLLERDFDWTGICAEPNPRMYAKLQENRRCTLTDACIGPRTGEEVTFVAADVYGGIEKWAFEDSHADKREAYRRKGDVLTMTTISLNDLLVKLGAPRAIDYLSIDTEGSEYEILSTFPFSEWQVRLITVEHNYSSNREPIRQLLEGFGYRRTEREFDDFYEMIA